MARYRISFEIETEDDPSSILDLAIECGAELTANLEEAEEFDDNTACVAYLGGDEE